MHEMYHRLIEFLMVVPFLAGIALYSSAHTCEDYPNEETRCDAETKKNMLLASNILICISAVLCVFKGIQMVISKDGYNLEDHIGTSSLDYIVGKGKGRSSSSITAY